VIAGHCGKCGAPYSLPDVWHGINPPTPTPSCVCWNLPRTTTTTSTTIVPEGIQRILDVQPVNIY
jgi:hypothetical protein